MQSLRFVTTGDDKQDDLERLFAKKEDGVAPKPPGAFTSFFELDTAQAPTPPAAPDPQTAPVAPFRPPGAPANLGNLTRNLNDDALPHETLAATERTQSDVRDRIPPARVAAWNDAAVASPPNPLVPRSDTFDGFFQAEASKPAQPSTSDFVQQFGGAGLNLADDRMIGGVNSASERTEMPSDILASGPVLPEPHVKDESQKATHLFSLPQPTAKPIMPVHGPSAYTQVIDASAQRAAAYEERASLNPPTAGGAAPQMPAPIPAIPQFPPIAGVPAMPAPVAAPQWPSPQMVPMQYAPPQAAMPLPAAAIPPALQPPAQSAPPAPQPVWLAYLPLIIGLNVVLFLTAIFILVFALLPK